MVLRKNAKATLMGALRKDSNEPKGSFYKRRADLTGPPFASGMPDAISVVPDTARRGPRDPRVLCVCTSP